MAFVKKTWKDRLTEFAGRRQLTRVSGDPNGTMVVDVTRAEGTVSQAGDAFSSANMNDLEQRIADEFTQLYSEIPNIPQMTPVNVNKSFTSSTSFAYTGISVKIPEKSYYIVTFSFGYSTNAPTSVSISNSTAHPSAGGYPQINGNGSTGLSITCSGYTETDLNLYGWAAYNGAHAQNGTIRGFYLSLTEKQ